MKLLCRALAYVFAAMAFLSLVFGLGALWVYNWLWERG